MTGGTPPAALGHRRATLGSPNFVALWGSTTASNLADGLFQVGVPLLALTLTRSPGLIAAVTLVLTLPWLLFALPVGALVDRLDRRRMMLAANLLRVAGLGLLTAAVALGVASLPLLYLVAFVMGIAEVAADIAAQALLPAVVAHQQLEAANARLVAPRPSPTPSPGPPWAGAGRGRGLARAGHQWRLLRRRGARAGPAAGQLPPPSWADSGGAWVPRSPKASASCGATGCCAPWP